MIYSKFNQFSVGTVKDLVLPFGSLRFCKCSSTMWLVEFSLSNEEPFVYTRFTQILTEIEAVTLFEKYEKSDRSLSPVESKFGIKIKNKD